MQDPSLKIEMLAEKLGNALGIRYNEVPDDHPMKRRLRSASFTVYEHIVTAHNQGFEDAIDVVEQVMTAESTPKRWLPGVQESLNALKTVLVVATQHQEVGANVPERLPDNFSEPDPYPNLRPGDFAPESELEAEEKCGAKHLAEWECTRPVHPPTWKHYDADLNVPAHLKGQIHFVWQNADDELEASPDYRAWVEHQFMDED